MKTTIAFVISQDGGISIFSSDEEYMYNRDGLTVT
jgi:hypothetical protein